MIGERLAHANRPWRGQVEWVSAGAYEPDGLTLPRVALVRRDDGSLYACRTEELVTPRKAAALRRVA